MSTASPHRTTPTIGGRQAIPSRAEPFPPAMLTQATGFLLQSPRPLDLQRWIDRPVADPAAWRGALAAVWGRAHQDLVPGSLRSCWSAFIDGIGRLQRPAAPLVPGMVDAVCARAERFEMRAALAATVAAGDRPQVERLAPYAFTGADPRDPDSAGTAALALVRAAQTRVADGPTERAWLIGLMREQTSDGQSGSLPRNLVADHVLLGLDDDGEGVRYLIRGLASGRYPPHRDGPYQCLKAGTTRTVTVVHWCEQQVVAGRTQSLASDETLVASLTALAIGGQLPGGNPRTIGSPLQERAARLLGHIGASHAS
jgi:hypothetical protein